MVIFLRKKMTIVCAAREAEYSPMVVTELSSTSSMSRQLRWWTLATVGVLLGGVAACPGDFPVPLADAGVDASASDARSDVLSVDASADAGSACDLAKPFSAPVLLQGPVNAIGDDNWIWLSSDMLGAFTSGIRPKDAGAPYSIFSTSRSNTSSAFGALTQVTALDSVGAGYGPEAPVVTADGLTLYFVNGTTGDYDIWVSTRSNVSAAFGAPQLVAAPVNVNGGGAGEDSPVWVSPDGTTLYFMSNRAGSNGRDIWVATKGTSGFGAPTNLAAVNSGELENAITLTPDELQAFVARAGKIYYTSRATRAAGFSNPVLVPELSVASFQLVSWVSADGCTVYLAATLPNPAFPDAGYAEDLYVASRGK
jgi:hypothetical protein